MTDITPRQIGKLGKLAPVRPVGSRMFAYYQTSPLPTPPVTVAVPAIQDWGMLGNDRFGNCTFCGIAHGEMCVAFLNSINEAAPTTEQTVSAYLAYTNGQDQGAVEADLLKYWQANTILSGKAAAYARSDQSDQMELKAIIACYGFVYIGIQVPAPCEQQFANHQPWALTGTPADNNILGGHCIILVGYDENYFYGITWGEVQAIEWPWLQTYMDESWAVITPEIVTSGKLGDLRIDELIADIEKL